MNNWSERPLFWPRRNGKSAVTVDGRVIPQFSYRNGEIIIHSDGYSCDEIVNVRRSAQIFSTSKRERDYILAALGSYQGLRKKPKNSFKDRLHVKSKRYTAKGRGFAYGETIPKPEPRLAGLEVKKNANHLRDTLKKNREFSQSTVDKTGMRWLNGKPIDFKPPIPVKFWYDGIPHRPIKEKKPPKHYGDW